MAYPAMAFAFVVGFSLATILYYMFDSNNSHQHSTHGTDGNGTTLEIPNSWTKINNNYTRRCQRRKKSNEIDRTNDCTICLTEIAVQHVSTQRCGHSFHKKCIQDWQQRGSRVKPTCPNCRARIDKVY